MSPILKFTTFLNVHTYASTILLLVSANKSQVFIGDKTSETLETKSELSPSIAKIQKLIGVYYYTLWLVESLYLH